MKERTFRTDYRLLPLSWLYRMGTDMRNKLFDWGWLRSKSFGLPVICIGNLSVGGNGKTPHTEHLVRLLQDEGFHPATLSRGYKRHTKGYLLASPQSTARQIGDEPCQMKQKFPDIQVAVAEDRCHGIEQLLKLQSPPVDVILLDDAFQHRHVKAGLNILLTDYNRLFCDDTLLPAGRLRESADGKSRAQIVIVTKCPEGLKPIDFNLIAKRLHLYPYQQLYFSAFRYGMPFPLFPEAAGSGQVLSSLTEAGQVLLVTGIASPTPLLDKVKSYTQHVHLKAFPDHHDFSSKDLREITDKFCQLKEGERRIITTEKDAVRLKRHPDLPEEIKPYIYVMPVEIEILQNQQHNFNQKIIDYVRAHSRNSRLPER